MGKDAPSYSIPTTTERMDDVMKAYTKYLPQQLQIIGENIVPTERQQLAASQEVLPQYTQSQLDLYSKYGPQLNAIGSAIDTANRQSQVATDAQLLDTYGKDIINKAQAAQMQADPEYYKTRTATTNSYLDLLNSLNPNQLTGGEEANVERNLNRLNEFNGTAGLQSNLGAIKNAMTFDDRLMAKKSALSQALQLAPAQMQSVKSGTDVLQQAIGRPSGQNSGENKFIGYSAPNIGATTNAVSANMFSQLGNMSGAQAQERQSQNQVAGSFDKFGAAKSIMGMVGGGAGAIGALGAI